MITIYSGSISGQNKNLITLKRLLLIYYIIHKIPPQIINR